LIQRNKIESRSRSEYQDQNEEDELKAKEIPEQEEKGVVPYDVGLLLLASHLGQSASPENLQIFRSTSLLLAFWELSRPYTHHGTKRIGQGSIC
jgi:hypothetical protein